jgi:hypothetical protein
MKLVDDNKDRFLAVLIYYGITARVDIKSYDGIIEFGAYGISVYGEPTKPFRAHARPLLVLTPTRDEFFRDYGRVRDFYLRKTKYITPIAISPVYFERFKNSPVISNEYIQENIDRVYGVDFDLNERRPDLPIVSLIKAHNLTEGVISYVSGGAVDLLNDINSIIGDAKVISIYTDIRFEPSTGRPRHHFIDLAILVDDNTRVLLNKLIYIYTHIKDFLEKKGITLKDILEDIDLYVSIAAAAAIDT